MHAAGWIFVTRHRAFLVLLLLTAALRLAILFLAQTHVHSDEAIIGLMGMRILEGRLFPVYMAGQLWNGGAAMEAYLAAASFAVFGAGVVPLKGCIVLLSLLSLAALYAVVRRFWDERTALVAASIYALAPTLLKWHFQVRGYGPYLLSIPILFGLFLLLLETRPRSPWPFVAFGAVAGLSLWAMELALPVAGTAAVLLLLRRALPPRQAAAALGGAVAGYLPALLFNVTHGMASWKEIAARKLAAEPSPVEVPILRLARRFFLVELPRFFGADTVMWYYPEKSATGTLYAIVFLLALALAVWLARRRVGGFLRDHLLRSGRDPPGGPGPLRDRVPRRLLAPLLRGALQGRGIPDRGVPLHRGDPGERHRLAPVRPPRRGESRRRGRARDPPARRALRSLERSCGTAGSIRSSRTRRGARE